MHYGQPHVVIFFPLLCLNCFSWKRPDLLVSISLTLLQAALQQQALFLEARHNLLLGLNLLLLRVQRFGGLVELLLLLLCLIQCLPNVFLYVE